MLNSKNVCLIMPTFFYKNPRSIRIAKALSDEGYNLDIICFGDKSFNKKDYIEIKNVNVYPVDVERKKGGKLRYFWEYFLFSIFVFYKLIWLFSIKRFWLIHVNNPPDTLVFTTIFHKLFFKVRVILDISEPLSKSFAKKFGNEKSPLLILLDKIQLLATQYSDSVITVSEAFKRELLRIGVDEDKITILPNSPDTTFYKKNNNNFKKSDLGFDDRYIVLYQGTVSKERGIDILVDAVKSLKKQIPNILGVIVGGGSQLEDIKSKVKEENLEKYFYITGQVPPSEVPKYVAIADICLLMALKIPVYELYSPDKLFEYMIYKKLIIAPKLQGILDITGEDGVPLYNPGDPKDLADKILQLKDDTHDNYLKKSELIYEKYKWDTTKMNMINCYKNLKEDIKK